MNDLTVKVEMAVNVQICSCEVGPESTGATERLGPHYPIQFSQI